MLFQIKITIPVKVGGNVLPQVQGLGVPGQPVAVSDLLALPYPLGRHADHASPYIVPRGMRNNENLLW